MKNDFDTPTHHEKFDYEGTVQNILDERATEHRMKSHQTVTHSYSEFFIGCYVSLALCISSLMFSRTMHHESSKLNKLNQIYVNEDARVAKTQSKDELVKAIDMCKEIYQDDKEEDSDDDQDGKEFKRNEERIEKKTQDSKSLGMKKVKKDKKMKEDTEMQYVPPVLDFERDKTEHKTDT